MSKSGFEVDGVSLWTVLFTSSQWDVTTAAAAAPPAPPALPVLFEQLHIQEYLPRFEEQKYLTADLKHLAKEELRRLVPEAGPRNRLERWIANQEAQRLQPQRSGRAFVLLAMSLDAQKLKVRRS